MGAVEVVENVEVPLSDGGRVAARVWIPSGVDRQPAPSILEYIPYRKRDLTRLEDDASGQFLAARGYAVVRADLRGSGESDGLLDDEYLPREQDDALELIAWIARQPWCNGAVGMRGISWGGFNALQVAARRPPALRAIVTQSSTDDRFATDVHYYGGCLLTENLGWGNALLGVVAHPPDPAIAGDGWRAAWEERLENAELQTATWLRHQSRDAYWRHGSVCEEPDAIACPVYAVAGLAEGYRSTVPRLLERVRAPVRGLVGPWGHLHPDSGRPGPAIGFLAESTRFWDRWLKGAGNGFDAEPALRVYLQHAPASSVRGDVPGHWVAEPSWPSPGVSERTWALGPGRLEPQAGPDVALHLAPDQTTGLGGGLWCPISPRGLPAEQGRDDERSLTFDTPPLRDALDVVGVPRVELELAVDQPLAFVSVRLDDVDPEGRSWLVSRGALNLTHRDGSAAPAAMRPGTRERVAVPLDFTAHRFGPRHGIRLAVSTCDWPLIWPSPRPVRLTLFAGTSRMHLPIRSPRPEDASAGKFEPPIQFAPAVTPMVNGRAERRVEVDRNSGTQLIAVVQDGGVWRLDATGTVVSRRTAQTSRIHPDEPLSAAYEIESASRLQRGSWDVQVTTSSRAEATADEFVLRAHLEATEGSRRVFSRDWTVSVPRSFV